MNIKEKKLKCVLYDGVHIKSYANAFCKVLDTSLALKLIADLNICLQIEIYCLTRMAIRRISQMTSDQQEIH